MSGFSMRHPFNVRNDPAICVELDVTAEVVGDALVVRRRYILNGGMVTPTVSEERIPLAQLEAEARDWLAALAVEWGWNPLSATASSARLQAPPRTPADDFTELAEELCECGHSTSFHAHQPDARSVYCFSCECEDFTAARPT